MANKTETVYLRGKLFYAKVLGDPRPNYNGDGREWTLEFEPSDMAAVENAGLSYRMKDKSSYVNKKGEKPYEGRAPFMTLRQKELNAQGERRDPIRIVDASNRPWDGRLLGNETLVDLKIGIVEYGPGKRDGVYPNAIRVLELVPYESSDFAPLSEEDEHYKPAPADTFHDDFGLEKEENDLSPPPGDEVRPKDKANRKAALAEGELDDEVPV